MNRKYSLSQSILRFRRWSRAGYAVFCSLACSVSIGFLAASVCEKSLEKSDNLCLNTECSIRFIDASETSDSEISEAEVALLLRQEANMIEISFDRTAACQHNNYCINCQNG